MENPMATTRKLLIFTIMVLLLSGIQCFADSLNLLSTNELPPFLSLNDASTAIILNHPDDPSREAMNLFGTGKEK